MASTQFDHEKLDAYQLQLGFIRWTSDLFEELLGGKIFSVWVVSILSKLIERFSGGEGDEGTRTRTSRRTRTI